VSFAGYIHGHAVYDTYERSGTPGIFYHLTRGSADIRILSGRHNMWGLELQAGVDLYMQDNWKRLSCVNNGQPGPEIKLNLLTVTGNQVVNPDDSFTAVSAAIGGPIEPGGAAASGYDPWIYAKGAAVASESLEGFALHSDYAVFPPPVPFIGGCTPGAISHARQTSRARRLAADSAPATDARVKVPRVTLDRRSFSRSALLRAMRIVSRAIHKPLGAKTTKRGAVALVIRDRLIAQASSRRRVARHTVTSALNSLVTAYNKDPAAARRAGIKIPVGQSAHEYFFKRRRAYSALLSVGAVRNEIIGKARTARAVRSRYRRWLARQLGHHRVGVRGLGRWSIAAALPSGV
jgi:hypothetical protein